MNYEVLCDWIQYVLHCGAITRRFTAVVDNIVAKETKDANKLEA